MATVGDLAHSVLTAKPSSVIARGMELLEAQARQAELERRALVPDDILDVLRSMLTELQMVNIRLGALENAMWAPRVRVPIRDDMGRIVQVIDQLAEPEIH